MVGMTKQRAAPGATSLQRRSALRRNRSEAIAQTVFRLSRLSENAAMDYVDFILSAPLDDEAPKLLAVQDVEGNKIELGHSFQNPDGTTTLRVRYRAEDLPDAPRYEVTERAKAWDVDNIKVLCRLIALSNKADIAEIRDWIHNHFNQFGEAEPNKMVSWLEVLPDAHSEAEERLWRALAGDDLTAILKGHLQIESLMEQLIRNRLPEIVIDRSFLFENKYHALRHKRLISRSTARSLQALNEVRNEFGHDPKLTRLTEAQWAKVRGALPDVDQKFIDNMLEENHLVFVSTETPANKMRLAILLIFDHVIAHMTEHMR